MARKKRTSAAKARASKRNLRGNPLAGTCQKWHRTRKGRISKRKVRGSTPVTVCFGRTGLIRSVKG